ncbi:MAG TPA: cupin domain-containing protein [Gaiellaceae bacterium]|nr:cupin domain-containing protein [Gaiellaceae bacterium]
MSGRVVRIDELELYPIEGQDGLTWRPVRRHFDIQAFGVNAYTAEEAGQRVVEEHREESGHEELYVVVSGRARFVLDGEAHDAPAGTLVHCPSGTLREAFAEEPGTTVLGIGAKPGEIFQPSGWEWTFAGMSLLNQGQEEAARREFRAGIEAYPDAWQGYYNLACAEARLGNRDAALENLGRAAEINQEVVARYAPDDSDFASVKDDPEFLALTRQSDPGGGGQTP